MAEWHKKLEARGVAVREDCEATGFARAGGAATAVQTKQGEIAADAFVLAAGALTPFLNDHLGCRIPIQPGKGYSITMPRPGRCPTIPLIFEEHRVAATPFRSGYRLGSMMEFVGYDDSISPRRVAYLKAAASHYLYEPTAEPVVETWTGWRPMTPDSRPIIDRSPALSNVVIAAGHNMLGLSMAPGTGKLVAELLSGQPPHLDPTPFAAGRF
jgi:D-amino-acid dehydrogenase